MGSPTGVVTFKDGATVLGTGTLTTIGGARYAVLTTWTFALGGHTITASYGGDAGDLASASAPFTVTVGPASTKTTGFPSVATAARGRSVVLYAVVADVAPGSGTPSGSVTFFDSGRPIGGGLLGTANGTTYTYLITSTLAPGTHTITAVYNGDAGDLTSTSSAFTVTISAGATPALAGLAAAPATAPPAALSTIVPDSTLAHAALPLLAGMATAVGDQRRAWLAALEALVAEKDGVGS
jgi:hypothetical protein